MGVSIEKTGMQIYAAISGDIDHHSAKNIREKIDCEIEHTQPDILTLDFKDVGFMDSSGIGLVMGRYKLMSEYGGEIEITNLSPHIRKVMRLAGLDRLAKIDSTKGEVK